MNEKVDEEYKEIKDIYILQCICSELKDRIEKYRHLFKTTKIEEKDKEIERLNNIIDKAIEYLKENACIDEDVEYFCDDLRYDDCKKLLEILKGRR